MKKTFSCPGCGADILFRSLFTMYNTCSYCQSLVVKHGVDLDLMGKSSEFPQDLSPLQIGTTGVYKKESFQIIGRQKVIYDKGFWNEWYIYFQDGSDAWLAEAQGFYMVSTELPQNAPLKLPKDGRPYVSQSIVLDNIEYVVDDIKTVTEALFTGELPLHSSIKSKRKSIDLSNSSNAFANIEYYDEGVKVFTGQYVKFDSFKFQNLREIDGW